MEKRNFTRVSFSGEASIRYNDDIFLGNIINLSLQGFYIKTKHKLPPDKSLQVTISQSKDFSINLHASVVRSEEDGLGMKIGDLDVHSFVRLRDVVSRESNDHTMMINETLKMLNLIH